MYVGFGILLHSRNSTEFAHLGYPGYPNAAGIAWIDMIKGEFQSNFTFSDFQSSGQTIEKSAYFGDYDLTVHQNGELVHHEIVTVTKSSDCDFYNSPDNLINDGDFDENSINSQFTIPFGKSRLHWDGYVKDSLYVFDRPGTDFFEIDITGKYKYK